MSAMSRPQSLEGTARTLADCRCVDRFRSPLRRLGAALALVAGFGSVVAQDVTAVRDAGSAVVRDARNEGASDVASSAARTDAREAAIGRAASGAQRIVSLAPNLTELAFAAGAGDRIVGTPQFSDYPQAARAIPRIGDAFRLDFERVLALRPEVVLVWEPGTPVAIVQRLRSLHLRVEQVTTWNLAGIAQAVRAIGKIAGTRATADTAATKFERDIEALRQRYSQKAPITVFLQINDQPLYTVNGKQIMSELLSLCGGRNVFAALNDLAPQIGIEAVIAANPEVIISTGDARAEAFKQWRRWPRLAAVASGNVYTLPPDDTARSTTRMAQGAAAICRTLETARQRLASPRSN